MTATQTLQVGLVGFGYAGRTFHAPLLQATPGLRLAAVASSQAEAVNTVLGADVTVVPDAAALLALPLDLIVIASPNDTHYPLARDALLAGKAVVIDKPMALDVAEAAELVALAAGQQRLLSVFHNRRWDGDFLSAAALLQDGRLGRLVQAALCFDRFRPEVRQRWRESSAPGGGLWADLGPHLLDQALQLFGVPASLQCELAMQRNGAVADDWFQARLGYASGLRVLLQASTLAALPGPRFELHGTAGSLRIWGLDGQEDALKAGQRPDPARLAQWGRHPGHAELALPQAGTPAELQPPQSLALQQGDYTRYYAGVRDALLGLAANPVPPAQALAVMQLLDLGRASARAGHALPVTGLAIPEPAAAVAA
ncbi:MAG TPA: oxidoreductase [Ideonella sp.]|uniref:oxidoreductase n=1 Tax=Ideonella sp. TaxID=1929293 RepID=UPI002B6647A0|nr:oxidoreductase [Ideonella sp.]HSI52272.1 oxidoreductase [Ideonella sp.]